MMKTPAYCWITVALLSLLTACVPDSTSEIPEEFQGTIQDVENLYSKETVNAIKDLGLVIHEGSSPPNIEGIWFASESSLVASNRAGDFEQSFIFADLHFSISNQDNDALELDFAAVELNGGFTSQESFISGTGNNFTVYLKLVVQDADSSVRPIFAYTFSGTLQGNTIVGLSWTLLMLDDGGDPEGVFIENNEGRRFVDSDGVSKRMCDYGSGNFDGSLNSIKSIFPTEAINQMQTLGQKVNEGDNPPNFGPEYLFNPVLVATTRGANDDNLIFYNILMDVLKQDNRQLTLDFKASENRDLLQGIRTFVSGSGNDFTIYSKVFQYSPEVIYQPLYLYIFSGTLNDAGEVNNFTYSTYMIDDNGDSASRYIENGDARYFIDQNALSKKSVITDRKPKEGFQKKNARNVSKGYGSRTH